MAELAGLTREDSGDLGFVVACAFASAISRDELRQWCYYMIGEHDPNELPSYILELAEFDAPLAKIYKVIGFVPEWDDTDDAKAALFGIAVVRGKERYEWPVEPEEAIRALRRHPEIEQRFRALLPFLELPLLPRPTVP